MAAASHIREACYSDIPQMAAVLAQAFWDGGLFGEVMHPHREDFPGDVEIFWQRKLRVDIWDYRSKFLVATEKDDSSSGGGGKEVVVGVAEWQRLGDGGKKMECWWFDPRNLLRPLSSLVMALSKRIWPNRAADPANEDIVARLQPFIMAPFKGERAEVWYLNLLGTRPDRQGRGVGHTLVRWGLAAAEAEDVWAAVIAAKGKDTFYQRRGFEFIDGSATAGEGNPLAGREGGHVHWKRPARR